MVYVSEPPVTSLTTNKLNKAFIIIVSIVNEIFQNTYIVYIKFYSLQGVGVRWWLTAVSIYGRIDGSGCRLSSFQQLASVPEKFNTWSQPSARFRFEVGAAHRSQSRVIILEGGHSRYIISSQVTFPTWINEGGGNNQLTVLPAAVNNGSRN